MAEYASLFRCTDEGAQMSRSHWLGTAVGLLTALTIVGSSWDQAQARASTQAQVGASAKSASNKSSSNKSASEKSASTKRSAAKKGRPRVIHGPNYHPPYADIVVDEKSGLVLHEVSADAPRHPASLTKIMTLYLLFEQLEAGKLKLDTPLPISTKASLQNPTKLGLKANGTIAVEDAIKGLCTKSANDAAVVIAEAIGGSEEDFARLMTLKARMLGMASTVYVNASGLPAEEQITTARDQALLGRAIQQRFPVYYRYFSTPSFRYRNVEMRNHNNLLGNVKGVDGIKTGYTEASGYNLTSSVWRDDRHIVAVVLGGTSNGARDARMRELIEAHIVQASTQRTAPMIAERSLSPDEEAAVIAALARVKRNVEPPALASFAAVPATAQTEIVPLPKPRTRPVKPTKQAAKGKQAANTAAATSKQAASSRSPGSYAARVPAANAPAVNSVRQVSTYTSPQPRYAPLIQR
jgi:D-alanyl-D-alanine carboxypeptidase